MDTNVEYQSAAPLRTSACLAWLIEYEPWGTNSRDIMLTSTDVTVERVIEMVKTTFSPHCDYRVANITNGLLPLMSEKKQRQEVPDHLHFAYSLYFGDARKVDSDGMVQI